MTSRPGLDAFDTDAPAAWPDHTLQGRKGRLTLPVRQQLAHDTQFRNPFPLEVVQACRYLVVDFWDIPASRQDKFLNICCR